MYNCSNCANCEFVVDRWEYGEVVGEYDSCKLDNSIIPDTEQLINCQQWKRKKVKPFDFTIKPDVKCPF